MLLPGSSIASSIEWAPKGCDDEYSKYLYETVLNIQNSSWYLELETVKSSVNDLVPAVEVTLDGKCLFWSQPLPRS